MSNIRLPVSHFDDMVPDHFLERIPTEGSYVELGNWYWGVFEHEGTYYRVKFTWGQDYYMEQVGNWDTPFPQSEQDPEFEAYMVECQEVRRVPVTSYQYEPVE